MRCSNKSIRYLIYIYQRNENQKSKMEKKLSFGHFREVQ